MKNEGNSDGNTVFPIKLEIFNFGFGSAEFRWSYFGFGFGSAETKKVISVAHYYSCSAAARQGPLFGLLFNKFWAAP